MTRLPCYRLADMSGIHCSVRIAAISKHVAFRPHLKLRDTGEGNSGVGRAGCAKCILSTRFRIVEISFLEWRFDARIVRVPTRTYRNIP